VAFLWSLKDRVQARLEASLPYRAWMRYGHARGGVLAGGMAYIGFFALLPTLALGFTIFGLIVGDDPEMQAKVVDAVNEGIGTVVITPPDAAPGTATGIVDIATLTGSSTLTIAGIIALVGFLLVGLGWLNATREGIRAMFGQPTLRGNVVKRKLRDVLVLATIGLLVLASAAGGVLVTTATGTVLGWIGLEGSLLERLLLGGASTLLLLVVDTVIFLVIFRLLAGVNVSNADLWDASLFAGVGFGILKLLSELLLRNTGDNMLLAAAAVVLTVLIWLNLVCRVTLVAASWGATVAIDRGHLVQADDAPLPEAARQRGRTSAELEPAVVGGPAPAVPFDPVVSPRAADRVSLVAGAVLGAAGLFALRTASGAIRTAIDSARHSD
jgi:membrane protein